MECSLPDGFLCTEDGDAASDVATWGRVLFTSETCSNSAIRKKGKHCQARPVNLLPLLGCPSLVPAPPACQSLLSVTHTASAAISPPFLVYSPGPFRAQSAGESVTLFGCQSLTCLRQLCPVSPRPPFTHSSPTVDGLFLLFSSAASSPELRPAVLPARGLA
ncbi:uncharacterized protein FOMMEDRAFT_155140 [Fomitiporia mediterranea MF3/22]|uniref:uncharacterized protein n=1 Tax=Fomitiporia mediterranea (strain MF3/22) TaxID=694068 RepID=UPI000440812B|nr:uncharacterized protein FOMMEDRAFT_155140 [Fomitiporia mediterranea MF3/22]EJD04014.1 hypothetical protein FOMMEDRAFT_155140 [Fomitiporia mediterranea MF3/22]